MPASLTVAPIASSATGAFAATEAAIFSPPVRERLAPTAEPASAKVTFLPEAKT
jgi:hypothetical protein